MQTTGPHEQPASSPMAGSIPAIVILGLCYCYAMIDRQVLSIVAGAIKSDIGLDDFQLGLLLGPAFAISYILFGIPLGILSDRWSRRMTISLGLVVWSIGTVVTGFMGSFAGLFAARALTGAGESALVPSAHAIIAEKFPRQQLARALSIFGWGASIGIGLSSIIGGILLEYLGKNPLGWLSGFEPWQGVFILLGIPGFAIAVLVLRLRVEKEPGVPASASSDSASSAGAQTAAEPALGPFLRQRWKLVVANYGLFGLNNIVTYCTLVWSLPYIERQFGSSPAVIGSIFGILTIAGPMLGSILLSALVDMLYARGRRDAHYIVFFWVVLLAAPLCVLGFHFGIEWLFWTGFVINALTFNASFAIGASALQMIAPSAVRARLSAGLVSFVNFTGAVVGPPLVGYLVTHFFRDEMRLGDAMALTIGVCALVMLPLARTAARLTRDLGPDLQNARPAAA